MNYLLIGVMVLSGVACLQEMQEKDQKSAAVFQFPDAWARHPFAIMTLVARSAHGARAAAFREQAIAPFDRVFESGAKQIAPIKRGLNGIVTINQAAKPDGGVHCLTQQIPAGAAVKAGSR